MYSFLPPCTVYVNLNSCMMPTWPFHWNLVPYMNVLFLRWFSGVSFLLFIFYLFIFVNMYCSLWRGSKEEQLQHQPELIKIQTKTWSHKFLVLRWLLSTGCFVASWGNTIERWSYAITTMYHVIVHVGARLWRWRVICMPIHLKGSAVCASLQLEQQPCCSNSNMQIVTRNCDSVFHLLLDFGSERKTPGGPRVDWKACQVRGPVGLLCGCSFLPFSWGFRMKATQEIQPLDGNRLSQHQKSRHQPVFS